MIVCCCIDLEVRIKGKRSELEIIRRELNGLYIWTSPAASSSVWLSVNGDHLAETRRKLVQANRLFDGVQLACTYSWSVLLTTEQETREKMQQERRKELDEKIGDSEQVIPLSHWFCVKEWTGEERLTRECIKNDPRLEGYFLIPLGSEVSIDALSAVMSEKIKHTQQHRDKLKTELSSASMIPTLCLA